MFQRFIGEPTPLSHTPAPPAGFGVFGGEAQAPLGHLAMASMALPIRLTSTCCRRFLIAPGDP